MCSQSVDVDQLQTLLDQLEKADGPDREIDHLCARAAGYELDIIKVPAGHPVFKEGGGLEFMYDVDGAKTGIPHYTASLDAAVALVEKVLPDWRIDTLGEWESETLCNRGKWTAVLVRNNDIHLTNARCVNSHFPALALLIAMVKALIAEAQS